MLTSPQELSPQKKTKPFSRARYVLSIVLVVVLVLLGISGILYARIFSMRPASIVEKPIVIPTSTPSPTPAPVPTPIPFFDPDLNTVLPTHRVVAFYAVPDAEATGPAFAITNDMLKHLREQGAEYEKIDPAHPVQSGIDLVVSVPDNFPGPEKTYSHHVASDTIQRYIDFCRNNSLLLFLDLNIGQAPIMQEVNFFLPYLEKYTFVHMAIDPEWMFPRHNGIPGVDLSNVRATDLNPVIEAIAAIPMQYHVPRKILIIHQYRGDGDGLANPYDVGQAEIADKKNLIDDIRVDVVIHVDSVGGYVGDHGDKIQQYENWVKQDMTRYYNFRYGGFKLFYHIEAKTGLITPKEVLAMDPPPMVVTYGN